MGSKVTALALAVQLGVAADVMRVLCLLCLSFLPHGFALEASPVDGYQIRNSLFLTQFLRSPAQASINIVEHEDLPAMERKAKYMGMALEAERARRAVLDELASDARMEAGSK